MKTEKWTSEERFDALLDNDTDWYLVDYADGDTKIEHRDSLSSVLDCGVPEEEFDIVRMQQCWGGEELGEEGEV